MKTLMKLIPLVAVILSSCTTNYYIQHPYQDDVYYSPKNDQQQIVEQTQPTQQASSDNYSDQQDQSNYQYCEQ